MSVLLEPRLDFVLPPELEASEPPEARGLRRDQVRLLVTTGPEGHARDARFVDLPDMLRPGDVVVANDSGTLPAALRAQRVDGRELALHLSTHLPNGLWVVEPRETTPEIGETLGLDGGGRAVLFMPYQASRRLWVAWLDLPEPLLAYLDRWGKPIAYSYVQRPWPIAMYQTVYAREPGSAEMPSAGRAFTPEILHRLTRRGITFVTLTLHTGVSSLENHEPPYAEPYSVPPATVAVITRARASGGRVIAVGTTVVRALESALDANGELVTQSGWTELIITPGRGVRVIDGLLTGFHEPKASHLAMLEAIAGRPHLEHAYDAALAGRYLWHEFGDLHLILPQE
jgi:S-adenosylmethionine:tRNA ribosyltransferase-isomerase